MRLNRGTIALLLVSLVVIIGITLLSNQPPAETTPTPSAANAGPVFENISADTVNSLEVVDNLTGATTVLSKDEGGAWEIAQATNSTDRAVDQELVSLGLSDFVGLESSDSFESDSLADFGLDQPSRSIIVTTDDGSVYTLHIGSENPNGDRYYALVEVEQGSGAPPAESTEAVEEAATEEAEAESTEAVEAEEAAEESATEEAKTEEAAEKPGELVQTTRTPAAEDVTESATEEAEAEATEAATSEAVETEEAASQETEAATAEAEETQEAETEVTAEAAEATMESTEELPAAPTEGPSPTPTFTPTPRVTIEGSGTVYLLPKTVVDSVLNYVELPPYVPAPTDTPTPLPTANPYSEVEQTATAAVGLTATQQLMDDMMTQFAQMAETTPEATESAE
jgi:chemotaxis protein histidine kinase CheA